MNIQLPPKLHCKRCGHRWMPRQRTIVLCPLCKSKHWNTKRTNRQGLRKETTK